MVQFSLSIFCILRMSTMWRRNCRAQMSASAGDEEMQWPVHVVAAGVLARTQRFE
jgi:hypothetical protein